MGCGSTNPEPPFSHSLIRLEKEELGCEKVSLCEQVHEYPVDIQEIFIDPKIRFYCEGKYNPHSHARRLP